MRETEQASPKLHSLLENIPGELTEREQWVGWEDVKVPINVRTGNAASTTDPDTWSPFNEVREAVLSGTYKGVGFVLTEDDPYTIIDLDHVIDPKTGAIAWSDTYAMAPNTIR